MLTTARVRELLGAGEERLSDADVQQLTEGLYTLARHAIMQFRTARVGGERASEEATLAALPSDDREAVEERAAVLEFDGQMTRDRATRAALHHHLRQHGPAPKTPEQR